ncbi:PspC domain-containing protein [Lentimicrobium sp.]
MNNSRLYRMGQGRVIGGVAGGIANFFGMDPTIVRLLFVLLVIFGGSGILLYIILWIILPDVPSYDPYHVFRPSDATETENDPQSGKGETYQGYNQNIPPGKTTSTTATTERKKVEGSLIGGTLLIIIGAIFLLDRFLPTINMSDLWPLLLIAFGVLLIFTNLQKKNTKEETYRDSTSPNPNDRNFPSSSSGATDNETAI